MIESLISSIKNMLGTQASQNKDFKEEAVRNNRNISAVLKDVSSAFASTKASNSRIAASLDSIESSTLTTSVKIDRTNTLLQESILVQNQMLSEMRNFSKSLASLAGGGAFGGQQDNRSFIERATQAAALTALGGTAIGGLGTGTLMNDMFGFNTGGNNASSGNVGYSDTRSSSSGGTTLSVADMVKLAKEAGFTDEQAKIMGAIGAAESSGNPNAHNTKGRDNSYGIWQVNMLGELGPERRKKYGLSSNEDLFDPRTNIKIAKAIFDEAGGSFSPWGAYTDGRYSQYLGTAQKAVEKDIPSEQFTGPTPQSNAMGGTGGNVYQRQKEEASIRKLPLSENLVRVLEQAASAAGVDVVVWSGGQPSKASGKGPRTGSTRHDDGNAADLYLMKDGRKLADTNKEDLPIMAKFVSAAAQAGATGIGAGHGYMGESSIHVGFGRPATWGGASWISAAASGVYSNKDLQAESSGGGGGEGYGGSDSYGAAGDVFGGIGSLLSAFGMGGMMGGNIMGMLSGFFGLPMSQMFGQEAMSAYGAGESQTPGGNFDESQEKEPEDQVGRSSGAGGPLIGSKEYEEYKKSLTPNKPNISDKTSLLRPVDTDYNSIASQIQTAALDLQRSPIVIQESSATKAYSSPSMQEAKTDFGAVPENDIRDTRASWAPRMAVLRPDDSATKNLTWAARLAPNLA